MDNSEKLCTRFIGLPSVLYKEPAFRDCLFYGMDGTRYRKHELVEKLEYEILAQTPAVLKYSSSEDLRGLKLLLSEPDGESTGIWTYQRRGWLLCSVKTAGGS